MSNHLPRAQRMRQQEWLYDRLIRFGGADFYWPMTEETLGTVGMAGAFDIQMVRGSIRKVADISREMKRIGEKREALARTADEAGHRLTAGQNWFMAAAYYTMAQGPIHEDGNRLNVELSARKNRCYENFIARAPHRIEKVDVPFEGSSLPGYLHFPPGAQGRTPCVVFLGGLDNFKEMLVTQPADKFLERGIAVLAIDGPGQNEARLSRGVLCTETNFVDAGRAIMDALQARSDIDGDRIGITGISMGSFWITQIVAEDHRYKAAAGYYICHEDGMNTIFNIAIPMFKDRYMWMAGIDDEAEFDAFAQKLRLDDIVDKVQCPYMSIAGEDDDLSPIECTYELHQRMKAPNTLLVYRNERHGVSDNMDVRATIADWMRDRLDGKPLQSGRFMMDCRTGAPPQPF